MNEQHDFLMEKRLLELDPILHKRFTASVFGLQHILSNYKLLFPLFTDHTELHSLNVIDFSNHLIGTQIERMNADEIYVLLMGAYLHDTGMGITEKDYEEFIQKMDTGDYFETHPDVDRSTVIRAFHNEFSGLYIRKYRNLFDIPSEEHLHAIIQIARGHRKTNMMDENEYPISWEVPGGHTICMPYLSALIRLADEIDVTAARNPVLLYDLEAIDDEHERFFFLLNKAVRDLKIDEKNFTVVIEQAEPKVLERLKEVIQKMQDTLDVCRLAVNGRTPYIITQEQVVMEVHS